MRLLSTRGIASGFGAGFSPFAPGTAGSLAAVPLAWALSLLPPALHALALLASLPLAAAICGAAAKEDRSKDPGWIVLDEIIGYCVAVAFLPAGFSAYLAGFLLFRLFDIVKPPPAAQFDRHMSGGWGILLDDVAAGLYTALALALLKWIGAIG